LIWSSEIENLNKVFIIAEAGVNHNGSLDLARKLIDAAFKAGADAVKFQTYKTEKFISRIAPKAEYQRETTGDGESQFEMLKKLELGEETFGVLNQYCGEKGIQFLSTPFDIESLDMLIGTLQLPLVKISSGDITNAPLLLKAAQWKKPLILSTGMSSLSDIETALGVLAFGYGGTSRKPSREVFREAYLSEKGQHALGKMVTLLHCTTEYPAPFEEVNLQAMDVMHSAFGLPVGYSDHTTGIVVAVAAVALGAVVIEKHFTLDRNLPGPDHMASLEPDELKVMVGSIRQVEKSLGARRKTPAASELKNKPVAQKSLVAATRIRKGEFFTEQNVAIKRPGSGLSPIFYWDIVGRKADKDYAPDEAITL